MPDLSCKRYAEVLSWMPLFCWMPMIQRVWWFIMKKVKSLIHDIDLRRKVKKKPVKILFLPRFISLLAAIFILIFVAYIVSQTNSKPGHHTTVYFLILLQLCRNHPVTKRLLYRSPNKQLRQAVRQRLLSSGESSTKLDNDRRGSNLTVTLTGSD